MPEISSISLDDSPSKAGPSKFSSSPESTLTKKQVRFSSPVSRRPSRKKKVSAVKKVRVRLGSV